MAPVPSSTSQVRNLRKVNNDQVAIAVDMDEAGSSRLEDEDDDKGTSRIDCHPNNHLSCLGLLRGMTLISSLLLQFMVSSHSLPQKLSQNLQDLLPTSLMVYGMDNHL